jgi:hypothetical protein
VSSNDRKKMDIALNKVVLPVLRNQGFKGSIPHLRRTNENNIDLITFQYNRWGGSFVVELAISPIEGVTMYWGEQIPPNKVNAQHINKRFRLGAKSEKDDGIWFNFEDAITDEDFEQVATNALESLNTSDRSWITNLLKYHERSD